MQVTLRQLFDAKVYLGHLRRFRNPEMSKFIFNDKERFKTPRDIIDLNKTQECLARAEIFIKNLIKQKNSKILFVGTKRIAQNVIKEQALRANMPYIDRYWPGGTLTNYRSIAKDSINRLKDMELQEQQGALEQMNKQEGSKFQRKKARLERGVGGIKNMVGLPDALFVIDIGDQEIAIKEARKLKIPIIGIVDTKDSPENIDYPIPGNDDAEKAVQFYATWAADIILETRDHSTETPYEEVAEGPVIKTLQRTTSLQTSPSLNSSEQDENDISLDTQLITE